MRPIIISLLHLALCSAIVADVYAEEITFRASGPVTSVGDSTLHGVFANPISVGDELRVAYTFEATADGELSANNTALYRSAIKSIRVEVSGNETTLIPCDTTCTRQIIVGNDAWQDPDYIDQYYVAAFASPGPPSLGFVMDFTRRAESTPISVLTSTDLPLAPPNPADFPYAIMFLQYLYPGADGVLAVNIDAEVTALEATSSKTPAEMLVDLAQMVVEMNVQTGISNALDAKLTNAIEALDRVKDGDRNTSIYILEAFINEVNAQRGNKLTDSQADQLVAAARTVIAAMSQA